MKHKQRHWHLDQNPIDSKGFLKVISYNVWTPNSNKSKVVEWLDENIQNSGDTIIFLMEVNQSWVSSLAPIKKRLPFFIEIPREDNFGVALYSSVPLMNVKETFFSEFNVPALAGKIRVRDKDIQIYGVHPLPPVGEKGFKDRNIYFDNLVNHMESITVPVVLFGDFNCSPWSPNFDRVSYLRQSGKSLVDPFTGLFRPHTWSTLGGLVSTAIDHVLFSPDMGEFDARIASSMGSDHNPVVVSFK